MRKILLLICLTFLISGKSFGLNIGHDLIDRNHLDGWNSFSIVDTSLQFDTGGYITDWNIYAQDTGDIYLQIFENLSGDIYKLIDSYAYTVGSTGPITVNLNSSKMKFNAGDYIGWTFDDNSIIGHNKTGGFVDWPSAAGIKITNPGQTLEFGGAGGSRTYSISADYQPVPEPTTWLLFGTGILGLLGYGRKKFFKKL